MTLAISKAAEEGAKAVICASTGNTSASAAAYAVRAQMVCAVLVPQGKIAMGKLSQALAHGATLLQVDGNFDDCLNLARDLAEQYPVALVNSVNPARIQGQKTAAFEVVDTLGDAPDIHVLPVGNAGNITAYWKGYTEYRADGTASRAPRMWGFQAAGAAPIVLDAVVAKPSTIATAIRIGNPASWQFAVQAREESGGADRLGDGPADPLGLPVPRCAGGRLRRAGIGRVRGRALAGEGAGTARPRPDGRLHGDRPRSEGSPVGDRRRACPAHGAGGRACCRGPARLGRLMAGATFRAAPVRVRVPATSANLGPGFDACGLSLSLYDDLVVQVTESGVDVEVAGEGAERVPLGERHLVVRSMRAAFKLLGGQPRGLALRCANRIPHGRGLGSSAAAIVVGGRRGAGSRRRRQRAAGR